MYFVKLLTKASIHWNFTVLLSRRLLTSRAIRWLHRYFTRFDDKDRYYIGSRVAVIHGSSTAPPTYWFYRWGHHQWSPQRWAVRKNADRLGLVIGWRPQVMALDLVVIYFVIDRKMTHCVRLCCFGIMCNRSHWAYLVFNKTTRIFNLLSSFQRIRWHLSYLIFTWMLKNIVI